MVAVAVVAVAVVAVAVVVAVSAVAAVVEFFAAQAEATDFLNGTWVRVVPEQSPDVRAGHRLVKE